MVDNVYLFYADVDIADYDGENWGFFGVLLGSISGVCGADGDVSVRASPLKGVWAEVRYVLLKGLIC